MDPTWQTHFNIVIYSNGENSATARNTWMNKERIFAYVLEYKYIKTTSHWTYEETWDINRQNQDVFLFSLKKCFNAMKNE